MMKVATRFAPSPTGGLHLGGVRTALFSYLYAKKHNGKFILRIEDTDQSRYVAGAEEYIEKCLQWCGLVPDASPSIGGEHAPYRQSERKAMYLQYAIQLVNSGHAYYAFDTPNELEAMRVQYKKDPHHNPQYDSFTRQYMRNSLNMSKAEVQALLDANTPHVIRIKVPENNTITFTDLIRGQVQFDSNLIDDKVLLKADGMPTYHLAVVVDDYSMQITHAFRGEEWLPSAPIHLLLWQYLGWEQSMPQWAHLPLILKPDGTGKLSKRDGDRLGFPVFAMDWLDPKTNEQTTGFKERGFVPQAFVNVLAMLGWNDGSDREIFSLEELIQAFDITRVHKGGAKFNYEKALWYNNEWIKQMPNTQLVHLMEPIMQEAGITISDNKNFENIIDLVKERCTLLNDIVVQAGYFYKAPSVINIEAFSNKWDSGKKEFFEVLLHTYNGIDNWDATTLEAAFKQLAADKQIKPGELQLPLRIMLVGDKYGPNVFGIAEKLGKAEVAKRVQHTLSLV
jgi:glutamyl-tRNA synthetase